MEERRVGLEAYITQHEPAKNSSPQIVLQEDR